MGVSQVTPEESDDYSTPLQTPCKTTIIDRFERFMPVMGSSLGMVGEYYPVYTHPTTPWVYHHPAVHDHGVHWVLPAQPWCREEALGSKEEKPLGREAPCLPES